MRYLRPATPDFFALFKKTSFPGKSALFLSSCFGVGLIPAAPGTFGTIAAIPLAIGLARLGLLAGVCFLALFILLAVWTSGLSAKVLQKDDPSEVVIDEMAGFLIATFLVPVSFANLCFGFFLFRLFDILKPYPIRHSEKIGKGIGIVLDDLLAGVYANLCLRFILLFVTFRV
jgi:phosphatidylglycerophosphatase A